jgi:hypothetical protein
MRTSASYLNVRFRKLSSFPLLPLLQIEEIVRSSIDHSLLCKALREELSYCMHSVSLNGVCKLHFSVENSCGLLSRVAPDGSERDPKPSCWTSQLQDPAECCHSSPLSVHSSLLLCAQRTMLFGATVAMERLKTLMIGHLTLRVCCTWYFPVLPGLSDIDRHAVIV